MLVSDNYDCQFNESKSSIVCSPAVEVAEEIPFKSIEFNMLVEEPHLPLGVVATYRADEGNSFSVTTQSVWDLESQALFPKKVTTVAKRNGNAVLTLIDSLVEFDASAPIDTNRCYLAYYGIPEPSEMESPSWWIWIGLAAVFASIGFFLMKRGR